jgi:surfeit locus 1 family protein
LNAQVRSLLTKLGALIAFGITLSLGNWQLDRAAQKEAIELAMDVEGRKPIVETATLLAAADPTTLVKQRAVLQGSWVADRTVFLDNRQMHAKVGFFVVTPLQLKGSDRVVWVQRGWIQRNFEERALLSRITTPGGMVTVEGRIAPPPSKLYELGAPSTGAIRQNLDLEQFRAETGLPLLPVMLQQTGAASEGLLRDWPAVNLGIDKHYGYAFQWFGLAALIALLTLWFQVIQPYRHRSKDSLPHV